MFIISAVLLGIILFFLGLYNFAFKKDTSQNIVQQKPSTETNVQKAPEKITAISDQAVIGPVFNKKNETILYYSAKDGTVWQTNSDGKEKLQIETTKLKGLKNVFWSSNQQKVLTMFETGGQVSFYEYDRQSKKAILLKNGLDAVAWDNLGAKIFYKYYDAATQKRSLNMANPDGSNWQKISDVDFRDISIASIPTTSTIAYWNSPDSDQESLLQISETVNGQTQTIFKGRYGGDYMWSPDGTQALVSSLASRGSKMNTLGLVTINSEYHDLNIPTIVSKCVWSSDGKTIYYALPGGIPDDAKMPNDYQENKFTTDDTFWKMDIITGQKERLVNASEVSGKYDSSNLFLSATGDALYFVNKLDGKLYRIAL